MIIAPRNKKEKDNNSGINEGTHYFICFFMYIFSFFPSIFFITENLWELESGRFWAQNWALFCMVHSSAAFIKMESIRFHYLYEKCWKWRAGQTYISMDLPRPAGVLVFAVLTSF